jgi:hypothetical protein
MAEDAWATVCRLAQRRRPACAGQGVLQGNQTLSDSRVRVDPHPAPRPDFRSPYRANSSFSVRVRTSTDICAVKTARARFSFRRGPVRSFAMRSNSSCENSRARGRQLHEGHHRRMDVTARRVNAFPPRRRRLASWWTCPARVVIRFGGPGASQREVRLRR